VSRRSAYSRAYENRANARKSVANFRALRLWLWPIAPRAPNRALLQELVPRRSQEIDEGTISVRAAPAWRKNKFEINVPKGIDKSNVLLFHRYR